MYVRLIVAFLVVAALAAAAPYAASAQASGSAPDTGVISAAPAPPASVPAASERPRGITATVAIYATKVIHAVGYIGVFLAMAAESMFLPVPAEAVMPFAGFLVFDGQFTFAGVIIISTLGSLAGSLLSYGIGIWGGRPFVRRYGKWVLLDHRDLELTERFFQRRGEITILVSRFIPVIRHLISLPAGLARMNIPRFSLFTVIGAGLYNAFLAVVGYYLREHWDRIMQYSHTIDLVVLVLLVGLVALYVLRHLRRRQLDRRGADGTSSS